MDKEFVLAYIYILWNIFWRSDGGNSYYFHPKGTTTANILEILINDPTRFEAKGFSDELMFHFLSAQQDGKIGSTLRININGSAINIESEIDKNIPAYKLVVHQNLEKQAEALKSAIDQNQIIYLNEQFELFAKTVLNDVEVDYSSDLIQSIFFHNAILSTVRRSIENGKDCKCTPHPGYFVSKTPFWCQEDYFVDTERFAKTIEESGLSLSKKETLLYGYLKKTSAMEKFVTIDRLFEITEDQESFLNRVEERYQIANNLSPLNGAKTKSDCSNGLGSDLGCCGNYSGCCWVQSVYCLDHDIECIGCSRWHCGPACR